MVSQKHGVSALGLSRALGITRYETAWKLLKKIRGAMIRPHRERLKGLVEVDEVFLGGVRPRIGGRSPLRKVLVLIAAEDTGHGIGRIRMRVISDATLISLNRAMREMIEPGSRVRTDGWIGYQGVERNGYRHIVVKREPSTPGDNPPPALPPRFIITETLAYRNTPRWYTTATYSAVSRRVRVSIQSTNLSLTRQIILPIDTTHDV